MGVLLASACPTSSADPPGFGNGCGRVGNFTTAQTQIYGMVEPIDIIVWSPPQGSPLRPDPHQVEPVLRKLDALSLVPHVPDSHLLVERCLDPSDALDPIDASPTCLWLLPVGLPLPVAATEDPADR